MKIILLKDIKDLGKAGDLVDAKDGYARNFLFPRKVAIEATPENMENWKKQKAKEEKEEAERKAEALKLKEELEKSTLKIKAKGGETGRLFGAITSKDISENLQKQCKLKVDRKKIELKDNIKTAGVKEVPVRVYPEITANLKVEIITE